MKGPFALLMIVLMILSGFVVSYGTGESRAESCEEADILQVRASSHSPIKIESDSDFTSQNGVSKGDGSEGNPYVIENWDINGDGIGYCIYIGNTTKYFIIRNCVLHDSKNGPGDQWANDFYYNDGISLYNTRNGIIDGNTFQSNYFRDIALLDSNDTVVKANDLKSQTMGASLAVTGGYNVIDNNIINSKSEVGVSVDGTDHRISNNRIYNHQWKALDLAYQCRNMIVEYNDVRFNRESIEVQGNFHLIKGNVVTNNERGISSSDCTSTIFEYNDCSNNDGRGISAFGSGSNNKIANNTCENNGMEGIAFYNSNTVVIDNICNRNYDGIYVVGSYCTVRDNIVMENRNYGIDVNSPYTKHPINSVIYRNNIINNKRQAVDNETGHKWYRGNQGNYWSDWTTPDSNQDGVVDNPYSISGKSGSKDVYPLTNPTKNLSSAPELITQNVEVAYPEEQYKVKYVANDFNTPSNKLTWKFQSNASWLAFSGNQELYGTPTESDKGSYWVFISVSDGSGTDSTNFTLSVAERYTGKTLTVGPGKQYGTIQSAIDNASSGDKISVSQGIYYENIVVDKSVHIMGNDRSDTIINGSYRDTVVKITGDSVRITNFGIEACNNSEHYDWSGMNGIYIQAKYAYIKDCEISDNVHGIYVEYVDHISIINCNVHDNSWDGINLTGSQDNIVRQCNVSFNYDGISLGESKNNLIENNYCYKNNGNGIYLQWCSETQVIFNTIAGNSKYGALLGGSYLNKIYYNNFIDNNNGGTQARDITGSTIWNTSVKGNHWSDWTTPDSDQDGIVDNPYSIESDNNAKDGKPVVGKITTLNIPPVITTADVTTAFADEYYYVKYSAYDPDTPAEDLNWTMETNAKWLNFSDEQELYGYPELSPNTYWVYINVSDGNDLDSTSFEIHVYESSSYTVINENTKNYYPTISKAVEEAGAGDTIRVMAGYYSEHVVVNKSITIRGDDKKTVILEPINISPSQPIFEIKADMVYISGMTLRRADLGFAISGSTHFSIKYCIIRNYKGMTISSSNHGEITQNTFENNTNYAITLDGNVGSNINLLIWNNSFLHNNGVNSTFNRSRVQVLDNTATPVVNHWNSSDGIGNYWSDLTSPDQNNDGIIDIPYNLSVRSDVKDFYPLTKPFGGKKEPEKKPPKQPPRVNRTEPEDNDDDVPVNYTTIVIEFSEPMDTESVEKALTITPDVNYTLSWSDNDTKLIITLLEDLDYNTTYRVSIGATAVDGYGIGLDSPFTWEFTTELSDIIDPNGKQPDDGPPDDDPCVNCTEDDGEPDDTGWIGSVAGVRVIAILGTVVVVIIIIMMYAVVLGKRRRRADDLQDDSMEYDGREEPDDAELADEFETDTGDMLKILKNRALVNDKKPSDFGMSKAEMLNKFKVKYKRGEISKHTYDEIKRSLEDTAN